MSAAGRGLVARGVMGGALESQERMDGRHGRRVRGPNADLGTAWTVGGFVRDRRAASPHHGGAGHYLNVYLEWLGKVPGPERRGDVSHVLSDGDDTGGVGAVVAIEDDATTVRTVLEDVRRGVLIDAHHGLAARLHRGER